jgi:omega-hydroxy-beta-dihydromenaquinone-9 sulfotransferase
MQRWAGGSVVVSKRIANNQRIPLLAAAFPDAVFVHLVRDGRAVVASLAKVDWWEEDTVWWYGGRPRQWRLAGGDSWELAARHWVRELGSIREGLSGVPATQRLELRYEDLLQAPVPTVRRVASQVALPPRSAWRREVERLRYPSRADAWRTRLPTEAVARIEAIQADDLRRHGYLA